MKTNLTSTPPSQLETDCLVAVVLDSSEKDASEKAKPALSVESADESQAPAAAWALPRRPRGDCPRFRAGYGATEPARIVVHCHRDSRTPRRHACGSEERRVG